MPFLDGAQRLVATFGPACNRRLSPTMAGSLSATNAERDEGLRQPSGRTANVTRLRAQVRPSSSASSTSQIQVVRPRWRLRAVA
jgi:hypothetical protein